MQTDVFLASQWTHQNRKDEKVSFFTSLAPLHSRGVQDQPFVM